MSNEKRQIYLNDAQYYFATMDARVEVAICGRGIGKGLLQAIRMLRMVQLMPRGSFGLGYRAIPKCDSLNAIFEVASKMIRYTEENEMPMCHST